MNSISEFAVWLQARQNI